MAYLAKQTRMDKDDPDDIIKQLNLRDGERGDVAMVVMLTKMI